MYTSPDEDRSDLFLAAAAFVLGPVILGIILQGLSPPPVAGVIVSVIVVLATTVLVPFLLIRYRKQRWSEFGFNGDPSAAVLGVIASLPVIAAVYAGYLIRGAGVPAPFDLIGTPVVVALGVVVELLSGFGTMLLVIYVVTKARTSFRTDPGYIRPTMLYLGRFTAIAAAVATLLLVLRVLANGVGVTAGLEVLLRPLGVAAAAWLVYRRVRGSQLTSRMILLTPMILLAIGSFKLFGEATAVVVGLWEAALLAGVGLIAAVLFESSRSAWAPLGFGAGLTMLTRLL